MKSLISEQSVSGSPLTTITNSYCGHNNYHIPVDKNMSRLFNFSPPKVRIYYLNDLIVTFRG